MPALLGIAVFLGLAVAAVDNFAFGGEVSPIVVVGMLLVATAIVGVLGGRRACGPRSWYGSACRSRTY